MKFCCEKNAHSLETLHSSDEYDSVFQNLPLCKNLKHFADFNARSLTTRTLEYLIQLKNLESLQFIYSQRSKLFKSFDWYFKHAQLQNLNKLTLKESSVDDKSLILISEKFVFFN